MPKMKVERVDIEPEFNPFELRITIETEAQARALYMIFDCPPIIHAEGVAAVIDAKAIRDKIGYSSPYYNTHRNPFNASVERAFKRWSPNSQNN